MLSRQYRPLLRELAFDNLLLQKDFHYFIECQLTSENFSVGVLSLSGTLITVNCHALLMSKDQ